MAHMPSLRSRSAPSKQVPPTATHSTPPSLAPATQMPNRANVRYGLPAPCPGHGVWHSTPGAARLAAARQQLLGIIELLRRSAQQAKHETDGAGEQR